MSFNMNTQANNNNNIKFNTDNFILNTYKRHNIAFEYGDGVYLFDFNKNKFLDFVSGIAVNSLGYNHLKLINKTTDQLKKLIHTSNLYYSQPQSVVAKKLIENSHFNKVFFSNSGTESVETALKIAKKYANILNQKNSIKRNKIIAFKNSFHGRTLGSLSATGQKKYQDSFLPLLDNFEFAIYNDLDSVINLSYSKNNKNEIDTCAIILELIQGEGGVLISDIEFIQKLEQFCKDNDILLIIDEVQTGIGRTGKLFAFEHFAIKPDIVSLAKGLGAGFPIGATLVSKKASDILSFGDHASTFGGNLISMTAASVVLEELLDNNLLAHISNIGSYFKENLLNLKDKYPDKIKEIRSLGLMTGIELYDSIKASDIVNLCEKNGLLVITAGVNTLRFLPPLIINKTHIDLALDILTKIFQNL